MNPRTHKDSPHLNPVVQGKLINWSLADQEEAPLLDDRKGTVRTFQEMNIHSENTAPGAIESSITLPQVPTLEDRETLRPSKKHRISHSPASDASSQLEPSIRSLRLSQASFTQSPDSVTPGPSALIPTDVTPPDPALPTPSHPLPGGWVRLALPIVHLQPLRLHEYVAFESTYSLPQVDATVTLYTKQQLDLLMEDIAHWKSKHRLTELETMVNEVLEVLYFDDFDRLGKVKALVFLEESVKPTDTVFKNLLDAYETGQRFYQRYVLIAAQVSANFHLAFLEGAKYIQHDQIVLRKALHEIAYPIQRWLSRPSPLLNKMTKLVLKDDMIPETYLAGILTHRSIARLAPEEWLDDDLINYFCGNPNGHHMVVLGANHDILYCSPLFWSSLKKNATSMGQISLDPQIYNSSTFSTINRILIPVLFKADHWIVLHANIRGSALEVLDSLVDEKAPPSKYDTEVQLFENWLCFLGKLFRLSKVLNVRNWTKFVPKKDIPQQGNTWDCGAYAIIFIQHLQEAELVNDNKIPRVRRIGKQWTLLNVARFRFWMELPKTAQQWSSIPDILRYFPLFERYATDAIPL
ncbi:hypothetical protein ONZ45_g16796 [Pleurotus djamor]|nr:hypothetical protein ONZ45_g16796 [Pleurotus djamor]